VGDEPLTIKGIVIPVDWDKKGKVVAAAISTYDEDEYLIDNDYKGKNCCILSRRKWKSVV